MKAIIEIGSRSKVFADAARQLAAWRKRRAGADYHLSFESASQMEVQLTPARIDLLGLLRRTGPSSVNALAKAAGRNYSNVHSDVERLEFLGLVERDAEGRVLVPFESIDIHLLAAA